MAFEQKAVESNTSVKLRLGDEVEMGNSVFKVALAVPNALEEDEATRAVDEADLALLHKDAEMAEGYANHDEVEEAEGDEEDDDGEGGYVDEDAYDDIDEEGDDYDEGDQEDDEEDEVSLN